MRRATPEVLVLIIFRSGFVPVPPGRPSMVTYCAPFMSIVAVEFELVMVSPVAPDAGLTVIVLTVLAQLIRGTLMG